MEKALYFQYDKRYTTGHRCRFRQLRVMLVDKDELEEEEGGDDGESIVEEHEMEANLNVNSVVGFDSSKTLKLRGILKGKEVDSGTTNNFVAK